MTVNCDESNVGGDKHVKVLLIVTRKVQNDMCQVDPVLVLRWLPLDLVDGIEGEWCLELRERLTKSRDQALTLRGETDYFEIVAQRLKHCD